MSSGNVAIITGGGGHIGHYTALKLASQGFRVAVCDLNLEAAQRVADEIISDHGEAIAIQVDVTNSESVNQAVETVVRRYEKVDVLVTAAGGSARSRMNRLIEQTDDVLQEIIGVNLFGTIYFARAAAQNMVANKKGKIICIGSIVGIQGVKGCVEYGASKGGVIGMTKSLAIELGESGITVNCVSPGLVRRPNEEADYSGTNYLGRNCTAEEVANLVAFLASDESSFITGQNYIIDGGRSLGLKGSN